jgi:recombination protein RecA
MFIGEQKANTPPRLPGSAFPEIPEESMSSAMVSTAAAQSRLFVFDADVNPDVRGEVRSDVHCNVHPLPESREQAGALGRFQSIIKNQQSTILAGVTPASHLSTRPAPAMLPSGIAAINALTGGWPRGCLTEICGPASSGRTTLMLAALAAATRRGEFCVLVDASDALDPRSAADAGVELDRLLWVRCAERDPAPKNGKQNKNRHPAQSGRPNPDRRLEQVLHATDLLLESGGFGLVILDLSDLPPQQARRIPLTTWFRFRRAVEHTPTVLLVMEQQPIAGSCSSLQLRLEVLSSQFSVPSSKKNLVDQVVDCQRTVTQDLKPSHTNLLTRLEINAELILSRFDRKPASSVMFETKTAWAG